MKFLEYSAADATELVAMWRHSFEHGVGIVDPNPIESLDRYLQNEVLPNNNVRLIKEADKIVAFIAFTTDSVSQLYVRIQDIGRGLGTHLLEEAKRQSQGSLWLYTFAQNANARRFYERHGFIEMERESANMYKLEAIRYVWQLHGVA
jgi:ribosomal protein S18 acetylase RimI-like enzyme